MRKLAKMVRELPAKPMRIRKGNFSLNLSKSIIIYEKKKKKEETKRVGARRVLRRHKRGPHMECAI